MNTTQIYAAMRERFAPPEWAIFFEVANGTGYHGRSYADAVAMNLYPSRGMEVWGFEIKVSRGDWLRECKSPGKAEPVFKYCDRWWLVVGDREIVKDGELPPTWGLVARKGKTLALVTQAPKLSPVPFDRPFFAALARRSSSASTEEIEEIVRTRLAAERERNKPYESSQLASAREDLQKLRTVVLAFEKASGISIASRWRWDHKPEEIGDAVKFLLAGGIGSLDKTLDLVERHTSGLLDQIKAVRKMKELKGKPGLTTTQARE